MNDYCLSPSEQCLAIPLREEAKFRWDDDDVRFYVWYDSGIKLIKINHYGKMILKLIYTYFAIYCVVSMLHISHV
jgi:hypothetical protein